MALSLATKVIAGTVGTALIGSLVVVGAIIAPALVQATMASEPAVAASVQQALQPPRGAALSTGLARFNGDYFAVGTEPDISLTSDNQVTIRKIGYGQTSFVTVSTTPSGVYSSDALFSHHVRYPGVYAQQLHIAELPSGTILGWSRLSGWVKIPLLSADSIGFLDDTDVPASQKGVCVADASLGGCR